jgi:hypothetical protein
MEVRSRKYESSPWSSTNTLNSKPKPNKNKPKTKSQNQNHKTNTPLIQQNANFLKKKKFNKINLCLQAVHIAPFLNNSPVMSGSTELSLFLRPDCIYCFFLNKNCNTGKELSSQTFVEGEKKGSVSNWAAVKRDSTKEREGVNSYCMSERVLNAILSELNGFKSTDFFVHR